MSDTITLTLTFDRQHLEGIARSHAMLRQEPRLPISTKDLRAALDAQEVQPLQPIDDEVEAFRKRFFERTGERLQRTAVVEGLRAALGEPVCTCSQYYLPDDCPVHSGPRAPDAQPQALEPVGEEPCKHVRFGEEGSSVYVFLCYTGWLECCACRLRDGNHFVVRETRQMLDHLDAHVDAGHCVPDHALASLKEHAAENDKWIANYSAGEQDKAGRDA